MSALEKKCSGLNKLRCFSQKQRFFIICVKIHFISKVVKEQKQFFVLNYFHKCICKNNFRQKCYCCFYNLAIKSIILCYFQMVCMIDTFLYFSAEIFRSENTSPISTQETIDHTAELSSKQSNYLSNFFFFCIYNNFLCFASTS